MDARQKHNLWFFLMPISLVLAVYVVYPCKQQIIFSQNTPVKLEVYTDNDAGGDSEGKTEILDSTIFFNYIKGSKLQFSYTGVRIYKKGKSKINLTPFNELVVSLSSKKSKYIPINLTVQHHKLKDGGTKTIILHYKLELDSNETDYTIPLDRFKVPTWWYVINKVDKANLTPIDLSNVSAIEIQCGELLAPRTEDEIQIKTVKLQHNPNAFFLIVGIITLTISVLSLVAYLFRLKYRIELVPMPYSEKEVENIASSEIERIQQFVSKNYHQNITSQTLQLETGIPKSRIPSIIKQELGSTLKQLLTSIRLNEAKRLLIASDLPVAEIADQVGFGNVSHFNRVFKANENISPLEFRKSNS